MSLLITRDYANKGTPLWLPTSGGTIDGNVSITGTLDVAGAMGSETSVYAPIFILQDLSGNTTAEMSHQAVSEGDAGDGLVLSGDLITFGKVGTNQGNTTFVPSVYGANLDNLTVGGTMNCLIGPVPTQAITSNKVVNPVATSPSAPSQFGVDNTITGIANAEYDIQAIATVYVVSGVPAADDLVNLNVTIGGGQGNMSALVFPGETGGALGGFGVSGIGPLVAAGAAATCYMRARLTPNASGTTLGANILATLGGGSTAVYGSTLTVLDVQRVR